MQNEEASAKLQDHQKKIETNLAALKSRLDLVFSKPVENDKVYNVLQKIFSKRQEIDFYRGHTERYTLRELANKRYLLGYPPRKKTDTSIGDAINWEWLVYIADNEYPGQITVSRNAKERNA